MKGFMKKKIVSLLLASAFVSVGAFGGLFSKSEVYAEGDKILVEPQACDVEEIPDKYNTGASGEHTVYVGIAAEDAGINELNPIKVMGGDNVHEIRLKKSKGAYVIDYGATVNNQLPEKVEINDYDFSGIYLRTSRENLVLSKKTMVFNNCIFDRFDTDAFDRNLSYEFYNCTFRRFVGSNAYFERCAFGGSVEDPLVPYRNIEVKSSYFSDLNHPSAGVTHIDATQIYGYRYKPAGSSTYNSLDAQNISYKNCRFEVPNIAFENNQATVNACVMIQLEFANAHNITVEDCILNGGVYSIYTQTKAGLSIDNVVLKNLRIGSAKTFGAAYPNIDANANFENFRGTDSLYIGSVYKQNGKTYFSVSNDTCRERKLKIITSASEYDFTVKAAPDGRKYEDGIPWLFTDFPLDIVEEINEDCDYAVCLDVTDENNVKQIRFVNYTESPVYIDKSYMGSGYEQDVVMIEGEFGTNLYYKVTRTADNDYILRISGEGTMPGYTKVVTPPWYEYQDFIKTIIVVDGVQNIGQFAFHGCFSASTVELPDSITSIGKYAFSNCSSIETINIPDSVESVGDKAFSGVQHLNEDGTPKKSSDSGDAVETPDDSSNTPANESKSKEEPKDVKDQKENTDKKNVDQSKKYSNEWVDGKWYDADGKQTYPGIIQWKSDSKGWWIEDTTGWYPVSTWQKINGYWYYFDASGYMASSEWVDGYWLGSDGAWIYEESGAWKNDGTGWWFEDTSGWYPSGKWQKIDGSWYYFDGSGYIVTNKYIDGYWLGSDGRCS